MWAHVAAGVITAWGDLPSLWWDGARQWDLRDPANIAPAGWVEVTPTDRPADTATTTTVETIELVDGIPTQAWVSRTCSSSSCNWISRRRARPAVSHVRSCGYPASRPAT